MHAANSPLKVRSREEAPVVGSCTRNPRSHGVMQPGLRAPEPHALTTSPNTDQFLVLRQHRKDATCDADPSDTCTFITHTIKR